MLNSIPLLRMTIPQDCHATDSRQDSLQYALDARLLELFILRRAMKRCLNVNQACMAANVPDDRARPHP